jgi:TPR repeat protein
VIDQWHLCQPGDLDDCTRQCDRGHLPSCVRLGNLYFEGSRVPKDLAVAAQLYELPCTYHIAAACTNRAAIYAQEHDMEHAAAYYDRACHGGEPAACYRLAFYYENGTGVPHDATRAAALYQTACDGDEMRGCSNLGLLYMNGNGVARDETRSARLFEKACAGGNAGGCGNLGSSYQIGLGVPCDPVRAAQLHKQACEGGEKRFCTLASGSAGAP